MPESPSNLIERWNVTNSTSQMIIISIRKAHVPGIRPGQTLNLLQFATKDDIAQSKSLNDLLTSGSLTLVKDEESVASEVLSVERDELAISTVQDKEINEALDIFAETEVDVIVLVDSFGTLYSEQIRNYSKRYLKAAKRNGKEVGFHGHNNLQLGFSNTIDAIISGVTRLDATYNGIGRGAGNCPLELLLHFLKNPKFNLRPILDCLEQYFVPLREEIEWGYLIPYMVTAHFNQHPRTAMALRAGEDKDKYVQFFDQCNEA